MLYRFNFSQLAHFHLSSILQNIYVLCLYILWRLINLQSCARWYMNPHPNLSDAHFRNNFSQFHNILKISLAQSYHVPQVFKMWDPFAAECCYACGHYWCGKYCKNLLNYLTWIFKLSVKTLKIRYAHPSFSSSLFLGQVWC